MIPSAIFGRYAQSLADVVAERQEDAAVERDLLLYREIFRAVPDLLDAFDSPAIPRDTKQTVLSELLRLYPVSSTTANFLQVLLEHNRIRYFQEILDSYVRVMNERKGVVAAQVTSASALTERELEALRDRLSQVLGKTVTLSARTDSSLLGGLVVQVGSTVYDGSVRRQLDELKQRLLA